MHCFWESTVCCFRGLLEPVDLRIVLKYRFLIVFWIFNGSFNAFFSADASCRFTHKTWRERSVENCAISPWIRLQLLPLIILIRVICFNDASDTKPLILHILTGLTCNYNTFIRIRLYLYYIYFRTYNGVNLVGWRIILNTIPVTVRHWRI